MKSLLIYSAKRLIIVAVGAFILFALIYIPLSKILKIDYGLLIIVNIMIFSFFLFPIIRGLLQGTKRFGALGWNMILESVLKLILAVILVYLGLRVFGAIIGVVGAFIIFFIVSFFFIRKIIKAQKEEINQKKILFGGAPILIVMLSIVLFYSIDIIIARAVFSDVMAGQYAVLSMIGKMIFFGTYAISKAMYPISTERFEENKSTKELIKKSLLIVLLLIILALLAISLFPRFIIWLLFGEDYTALAGNLIYVSIGFSILSVTNIILLYGLSKNKINFIPSLSMFLFIIAEVVLLSIFNDSITQFAVAFIGINFAMFIWSLVLVARKK